MPRTLSEHAAYELTQAGLSNSADPEARRVAVNIMALVRRIEKQHNTEKGLSYVLEGFSRLANHLPLTALTTDPDEWEKFEVERKNVDTNEVEKKIVWQSRRAPSFFSEDEGKNWIDQATGKMGTSVNHIEEAARIEKEKHDAKERKAAAEARATNSVGHVQPTEVPAAEQTAELPKKPASKPAEAKN